MVRPKYAQDVPDEYGAVVRHYVDPDDRLAMEVGAGHEDKKDTYLVHDKKERRTGNEDAITAHTTYHEKAYPHDSLPFTVDTEKFKIDRGGVGDPSKWPKRLPKPEPQYVPEPGGAYA